MNASALLSYARLHDNVLDSFKLSETSIAVACYAYDEAGRATIEWAACNSLRSLREWLGY